MENFSSKVNRTTQSGFFFGVCSGGDEDQHLYRITCPSSNSCKEYSVCPMGSELDKGGVIIKWLTWIWKVFLPLTFTVVAALFLVMFLWWNWILKKKTNYETTNGGFYLFKHKMK
ncbi:hypothetical protein Zmor_018587 [Zophobas morio]|uniref:Uncharacterized protein n=1 Tax=Zophobas morio TaxID=2755281 RepID=A0AA38ICN4_9CUCU|nr:hypothetical protein Zmor_018587 [Zophobas morio]